jgi:hypothetical protein
MTFLNIALLGGLAAFAIPILIHLFHRRRVQIVRWGAMHLLEAAVKKHRRRIRLEQLILLLIRCAIPALLACALARPVLSQLRLLVGDAKSSVVFLLDNSYSMDSGESGQPNFVRAKQALAQRLDELPPGSDAAVILLAGGNAEELQRPTTDLARITRTLLPLEAAFGRANLPAALESAGQILAKMQNSYREVVLVGDSQRINFPPAETPARRRALDILRRQPMPPHLTFFVVGAPASDNIAVESLDFSRPVLGVGQPVQIRATLRNFGSTTREDLHVALRVDGAERNATRISLGPREQRQLLFTHSFDAAGSHLVEVRTDGDALQADNALPAAVPVWDKVPVLLVNGDPSREPLRGETDFLQIALQPFGAGRVELADLITPRVIEERALNADALAAARVLVLANVRQLSDTQLRAVDQFVRAGGGLLILPGDQCNTDWYNRALYADGNGMLPVNFVSLAGSLKESAAPARIAAEHFDHPALDLFNDPRNGNLAEGEIRLWFKLGAPPSEPDSGVALLARLDSGDPFLVEKRVGEGRVIVCATAGDADWSDLPTRQFYLPLAQRLVTHLASTALPPRNVEVGHPLAAFFARNDASKKATVTDPAGTRHELPLLAQGQRSIAEFRHTDRPGLYLLNGPDGSLAHFVVRASREESDLTPLSEGELADAANELGATLVRSWSEYRALDRQRRFGRELWKPLLWGVLALVAAELILQQWFARRTG